MSLNISIIISTYNRVNDLDITIDSICAQSLLPYELIIVDDSTDEKIKELMDFKKIPFKKQYIWNKSNIKSSAISRNIGLAKMGGDIALFLDDDVTLDKNYIKLLQETYSDNNIMALQGYIKNISVSKFYLYCDRIIQTIFLNADMHFDSCNIKKGVFGNTYPIKRPKHMIVSQWLAGCNMSCRKEFLDKHSLRFDENLLRYAFKEDADLSYRAYKICKDKKLKIVLNPKMLLDHRISKISRIPDRTYTKIKYVYAEYFFFKNTNSNIFIFYWSLLGQIVQRLILSLIHRDGGIIGNISGCLYSLKHINRIKEKDLSQINKELFNF
ncbi:MAG: glycosyltransferase family 2 protein [DPANN group archaeon]|nr:glycosyltransferase family 2 protein [DPANN group archaeon]